MQLLSQVTGKPSLDLILHHIRQSSRLAKVPLSLFVAFSAVFGSCLTHPVSMTTVFGVFASVFLLSCASATLNNIQDRDIDALSKRTRNRPLPRGLITLPYAWMQTLGLFFIAMVLLTVLFKSAFPPVLGLTAVCLYNGAYTPLKRHTLWAMVPGTLCGMLPPLIGWTASGGNGSLTPVLIAMLILGFWQIPHTWLICLHHAPARLPSGLPSFSDGLNLTSLKGILFIWVLSFAVLTVMLFTGTVFSSDLARWLVVGNALILTLIFFSGLFVEQSPSYNRLFVHLNLALAIVMVLALSERFSILG